MMRSSSAAAVLAVGIVLAACDRSAPPAAAPAHAAATPPAPAPVLLTSADVDARLQAAWTAAGVSPTAPADDATWLRRAWLDVLGTIPPPEVVTRFLADTSPDRRAKAVDAMLASPLWADHWTDYWDEVWMGRTARAQNVDRGAFRAWLHDAFAHHEPWDRIVTELLTADGVNSAGGKQRDAFANDGHGGTADGVNGAVNWTLKYAQTPQDMAGTASRTLLGVQIQCAQCHDHKTEKWKQTDFQAFAATFMRTRFQPLDEGKAMGQVQRIEVHDLPRAAPRFNKMGDLEPLAKATPRALDGTDLTTGGADQARVALARWMTSPQNPWFARALVNRMWGHFLGRGFVDPVDDMRPSNPASAPELLDALAADFTASGDDLGHLVRVIVGTKAYGLSAAPMNDATAKADPEAKLWERFRVTPMGPEELLGALVTATRVDAVVRATGRLDLDNVRFRVRQRYGFLFDVDEESDEPDFDGTIAQALALINGSVVGTGTRLLPASALADVMASPGDDATKIGALYLRSLSRFPTADETTRWQAFLADAMNAPPPDPSAQPAAPAPPGPRGAKAGKKGQGKGGKGGGPDPLAGLENRPLPPREDARARAYEDLLWTLLNSSEFALNH